MLFNSQIFGIFFLLFFIIYWLINNKNIKIQNVFILLSSILFYGWWDWRFILLILFSSLIDFYIGYSIHRSNNKKKRKVLLLTSISINIGLLAIFKYLNFFIESFIQVSDKLNFQLDFTTLNIILPVGISFYTFQTLSYTLDIYNKKLTPTKDIIAFASFVCFFPQLVAGPIERAKDLLPQFFKKRIFSYKNSIQGVRQILWGLFKKIAIADFLSPYVDEVFSNYSDLDSISIIIGIFYFGIQIYCDFSGYSDIAIGVSRMIGFNLSTNFKFPYFSKNISEFWHRWHISLSSWFRDYVYIPLGGSRSGKLKSFRNVSIVFLLSGLWHGANLTYIVWGAYHALLYLPNFIIKNHKSDIQMVATNFSFLPSIKNIGKILFTLILVNIGWVFFRAPSITVAINIFEAIVSNFTFSISNFHFLNPFIIIVLLFFYIMEWKNRNREFGLDISDSPIYIRKLLYLLTFIFIFLMYSPETNSSFIYFQF